MNTIMRLEGKYYEAGVGRRGVMHMHGAHRMRRRQCVEQHHLHSLHTEETLACIS